MLQEIILDFNYRCYLTFRDMNCLNSGVSQQFEYPTRRKAVTVILSSKEYSAQTYSNAIYSLVSFFSRWAFLGWILYSGCNVWGDQQGLFLIYQRQAIMWSLSAIITYRVPGWQCEGSCLIIITTSRNSLTRCESFRWVWVVRLHFHSAFQKVQYQSPQKIFGIKSEMSSPQSFYGFTKMQFWTPQDKKGATRFQSQRG